jgi:ABC-type uncharacterized transport system substrate-binding protein
MMWYFNQNAESPYMNIDANVNSMDYYELKKLYDDYNALVTTYNGFTTTFNDAAALYNTAAKAEAARKADAMKAAFDAPIAVPARPCGPNPAVAAYAGLIYYDVRAAG